MYSVLTSASMQWIWVIIYVLLHQEVVTADAPISPPNSANLLMGNPSGATTDPLQKDNFLMNKPYFSLSYNNSKATPNWVSWRLGKEDFGDEPRVDFFPDMSLPEGFTRIVPQDYTGSGFDRGHMCPHSDRDANPDMNLSTFVMTNIVPQSPNLNQKAWRQVEEYNRSLVEGGKVLYTVTGPYGKGGEGSAGKQESIGTERKVQVPEKCWKVVMVINAGSGDDMSRVNSNTRLIAVIMPNDMSVGESWANFRVSVKDVENLTGYTFFDQAPQEIIGPLKEKVDEEPIPPPT